MPHARTASHAFAKGTGFSESEKDRLGIRGLVPPRVFPMDMQLERIMLNLNQCRDNLEKYVFLSALSDRNLTAFYKVSWRQPHTRRCHTLCYFFTIFPHRFL